MLNQVMKKRRYRSLFLVDISLPFSIGSDVSQIDSVYLYDIRDLRQVVDQNLALRNSQRLEIEHMIADSVAEYCHWLEQQEFSGVIEQMAKLRQTVVSTELDKFYSTAQEGRESAQRVADAVAAKFVHSLMLILKDRDLSAEAKRQLADKILSTLS
jgi:glutamyl-tRNA reductase